MGNTIRGFVRSGLAAVVAIATLLTLALSGATASADATTSRVDISTIASSSTINLYKDEAETEPITTGTPINRGDTVYGSVSILFPAGSLSPENPNLEYDFPNDITVGDLAQHALLRRGGFERQHALDLLAHLGRQRESDTILFAGARALDGQPALQPEEFVED